MARSQWGVLICGLALITAPSLALAQGIPNGLQRRGNQQQLQQQQQQQAHQELKGKGELEAVGAGGFSAVLDGQPWNLAFEPKGKPKIEVVGSATADALAPGMFVKFKGDFDKKGAATAAVKELEIFTPNEKEPPGATPVTGAFEATAGSKKGPPSNLPTTYDIAGRITGVKNGTITVSCPSLTVHADVAPDATIKVNVADLRFATHGDTVEVHGWYGNMKGRPVAYATEVKVQLANPLTGPAQKKKAAHPAKTADKTGDKSTDATDTAGGDKKTDKLKNGADAKAGDAKAGDAKADDTKAGDKAADAKSDKDAGK